MGEKKSYDERFTSFVNGLKSLAKKNDIEFITMNRIGLGIRDKQREEWDSRFILLSDLHKEIGVTEDIEY